MVADFALVHCHLLLVPHDVVKVSKVVVHVDAFVAIATIGPTSQLGTLQLRLIRTRFGGSDWLF